MDIIILYIFEAPIMGRKGEISNNSHIHISHCLVLDNVPMLQDQINLDCFLKLDFSREGCVGLIGSVHHAVFLT